MPDLNNPAAPDPAHGGSFARDPVTGTLTQVEGTAPQADAQPEAQPDTAGAQPAVAAQE